jgi:hypothetical protein
MDDSESSRMPYSNSQYVIKETYNSSLRNMRPSSHFLPLTNEFYKKTKLPLGIYFQPFADRVEGEQPVPVVSLPNDILICSKCKCYVNNRFTYSDIEPDKKRLAYPFMICNLCKTLHPMDDKNNKINLRYYWGKDISSYYEMNFPTVDFKFESKDKKVIENYVYYTFIIDISENKIQTEYVVNSILTNLEHLAESSDSQLKHLKVAFMTFDSKSVQFYYVDIKNNDIKISIMPSIDNPFCPVPNHLIFFNLFSNENQNKKLDCKIYKIFEKINSYIGKNKSDNNNSSNNVITSAIYSAYEVVKNQNTGSSEFKGYNKFILFNFNKCGKSFKSNLLQDFSHLLNNNNGNNSSKVNPLFPQQNFLSELAQNFLTDKITFDFFNFAIEDNNGHNHSHNQIHFPTFSQLSNKTGGSAYYYVLPLTSDSTEEDKKSKLEKFHYDLNRLLSRKYYYDVKVVMFTCPELEVLDIVGNFGKKNNSPNEINFSSVNSDINFISNLRIKKTLKDDKNYDVQMAIVYTNPEDMTKYIRTLNWSFIGSDELDHVYLYMDSDCLTKMIVVNELTNVFSNKSSDVFEKIRKNIENMLIHTIAEYKAQVASDQDLEFLSIPSALSYFPMYLNSFIKKYPFRKQSSKYNFNLAYNWINFLISSPVNITVKTLFPRLYRVDDVVVEDSICEEKKDEENSDEQYQQSEGNNDLEKCISFSPQIYPLSLDYISLDSALIYDNGSYLFFIIGSEIKSEFIQKIFGLESFIKLKENSSDVDLNNLTYHEEFHNFISKLRVNNYNFGFQSIKLILIE